MQTESAKPRLFYGWVIVMGGIVIMATVIGIGWNCFSQFIKPVCADMGFTRQAMGANVTLLSFSQMFLNFGWGYILRHFSLRKMLRTAAILNPLAYFCYSFCRNIWMFYACSVVIGVTMNMLTTLSFSLVLSNWFHEKRGTAIGLTFMGTGLGGMVFNPLAAALIGSLGWRMAYRVLGVIILLGAVIPVYFVVRLRPQEMGLRPLGWEKESPAAQAGEAEEEGMMFSELIHTARFRAVCLCVCFATTAIGCLTQLLSPHLTDNGYSTGTAAFMVSLGMAALAFGKMSLGVIYDRLGTRRSTLLSIGCGALGLVGMVFCRVPLLLPLVLLGQCFGSSFGTVAVPIITQNLFGKKDYGQCFGFISACSSIGGAISPTLNGAVFDRVGSYNPAVTAWFCLLLAALAILWAVLPRDPERKAGGC